MANRQPGRCTLTQNTAPTSNDVHPCPSEDKKFSNIALMRSRPCLTLRRLHERLPCVLTSILRRQMISPHCKEGNPKSHCQTAAFDVSLLVKTSPCIAVIPSQNNNNQPVYPVGQAYPPSTPQFQQQQNFQPPQTSVYSNGIGPNMMVPQYEQPIYTQGANPAWNGQITPQQQPPSPVYGAQSNSSLPPPPWEAQSADNSQLEVSQYPQPMQQVTQVAVTHAQPMPSGMHQGSQPGGMYIQPMTAGHLSSFNNQGIQSNQMAGIHPQQIPGGQMGMYPQQMQSGQMAYMNPQQMYSNQMAGYGYGYGQQQNAQFLDQRMYGLSVRDDGALRNPYQQQSTPSYVPPGKPSKPEDKLFGDLVDIAKFKPTKTTPGRAGSM